MRDLLKPETLKALAAELIGTCFLTLAALLAGTPYAVALTLAAFVYIIGNTSGCHVNPAVTAALVAARRLPVLNGILYVVAQLAGALLAAGLSFAVGTPLPDYQAGPPLAEFFGFGLLILTVMAVSDKYVPQAGSGIAIGAALAAGLLTSNGILNPAVAVAMSEARSPAVWATLLGGVVFALLFSLIAPAKKAAEAAESEQQPKQAAQPPRRERQPALEGAGAQGGAAD